METEDRGVLRITAYMQLDANEPLIDVGSAVSDLQVLLDVAATLSPAKKAPSAGSLERVRDAAVERIHYGSPLIVDLVLWSQTAGAVLGGLAGLGVLLERTGAAFQKFAAGYKDIQEGRKINAERKSIVTENAKAISSHALLETISIAPDETVDSLIRVLDAVNDYRGDETAQALVRMRQRSAVLFQTSEVQASQLRAIWASFAEVDGRARFPDGQVPGYPKADWAPPQ